MRAPNDGSPVRLPLLPTLLPHPVTTRPSLALEHREMRAARQ